MGKPPLFFRLLGIAPVSYTHLDVYKRQALYHLATEGETASAHPGVDELIRDAGLGRVPGARVAAFVGNAWDPQEGRETPWIDLARQLAGEAGVRELGPAAQTIPPGTEALGRVFKAAGGPVLVLFDEVLNFLNRHRGMAEEFHSFIQNLTVAVTGTCLLYTSTYL